MASRYTNNKEQKLSDGRKVFRSKRYPNIPKQNTDIYVVTQAGDRLDELSNQFYNDSSLWWIIANANGILTQGSLTPPIGSQIRIPINPTPSISAYQVLNQ